MADEHRQFAIRLRRQATEPEDILWELLRSRRLDGMKFRRQEPLLGYTVDFFCPERKLVIEIDGRNMAGSVTMTRPARRKSSGMASCWSASATRRY